ncbi:MAG: hypothetical protein WCR55_11030 [Lentisphaerota bacterium]
MKIRLLKILTLLSSVIILASCSTEYNKDNAADKARAYVFEQIPRMSPQNASYIKYTYPKLLTAPIYSTAKTSEKQLYWNWGMDYYDPTNFSSSRQFSQVAFTWDLPDPKVSVLVLGTCYDNYQGWYPIRLILREAPFTPTESDTTKAKDEKPSI